MEYLYVDPDKSMQVIDKYLIQRLSSLEGKDRRAVISEFKEWLLESKNTDNDIWTIPDLTDDGLRDFFTRAISRKYS